MSGMTSNLHPNFEKLFSTLLRPIDRNWHAQKMEDLRNERESPYAECAICYHWFFYDSMRWSEVGRVCEDCYYDWLARKDEDE